MPACIFISARPCLPADSSTIQFPFTLVMRYTVFLEILNISFIHGCEIYSEVPICIERQIYILYSDAK